MGSETYDTIVIGTGQAGPGLASTLAGRDERVALLEERDFGGTCLNAGCRPTKALLASARAAHVARSSDDLGVSVDEVRVDLPKIIARKDGLVGGWREGAERYFGELDGVELVRARGAFAGTGEDGHVVEADGRSLVAPRVVVNVGARSVPPPIPGLDSVDWMDHHRILALTEIPDHLVVVGGSYLGIELAQIFSRFGAKVTVLERLERIVSGEDPESSKAITDFLSDEGLTIHAGASIDMVRADGDRIAVDVADVGTLDASHMLIAAGRVPNSDGLGLDTVGVETDERGYIRTDDVFASNVEGIYALGDVNGRGAFTHTSYQDYEILADHLAGGTRTVADRVMTYALYTDPPMGRVGMTETQAAAAGIDYSVASYPMSKLTRAVLDGETAGFIKLIVDNQSGRFLGATTLGLHGDETIQTISALMHVDAPASVLGTWLPVHPTVAEFFPTILALAAPPGGG